MTKFVVILGFLIAFAAGLVVGIESRQSNAAAPTTRPSRAGWLAGELNLTTQQQEQLSKIWSETARRGRSPEQEDRRHQLRKERDESIAALVAPQDKTRFEQIMK